MPLNLSENRIAWVLLKLSGATEALRAEALKLNNCLLRFGCASKELRVEVAGLEDWLSNSSYTWSSHRGLMVCRLVALGKFPGVHPVGIGETLRRDLAKLVIREAGYQAKVA